VSQLVNAKDSFARMQQERDRVALVGPRADLHQRRPRTAEVSLAP
jgi:hypothetical protein